MNKKHNEDQELRDQYEEAFFKKLMQGYDDNLGNKLMNEAHDHPAFPSTKELLQIKKLIRRELGKQHRQAIMNSIYRRRTQIAISVLIILGVFTVGFVTVDAFRLSVLNFFSHDKGTYTEIGLIDYSGEKYIPTYIPDGMSVTLYDDERDPIAVLIEDDQGFFVNIFASTNKSHLLTDTENSTEIKTVTINNIRGQLSLKNNRINLSWHNATETAYATLNTNLQENDAINIAQSINLY